MEDGAGFAGFAAGEIGQGPHDPDLAAMPDVRSLHAAAVEAEASRAWPATCTSRARSGPTARARSCAGSSSARARWATSSWSAPSSSTSWCASARTARSSWPTRSTRSTSPVTTCAASRATSTSSPRWRATSRTLGWGNYATDHEDANGQFEQNFEFADALTTCDRAIFFRYMVESLAQERGMIATFMPKPFSPPDRQRLPLPHEPVARRRERLRGATRPTTRAAWACRRRAYQFIGGLKAHAKAYIAVTAPTVTSYKRLVVGSRSGASWAPVYVSYGYNNRTQMLRMPGPGRVEDRTVDGSCNPYLARCGHARGRPRRHREASWTRASRPPS